MKRDFSTPVSLTLVWLFGVFFVFSPTSLAWLPNLAISLISLSTITAVIITSLYPGFFSIRKITFGGVFILSYNFLILMPSVNAIYKKSFYINFLFASHLAQLIVLLTVMFLIKVNGKKKFNTKSSYKVVKIENRSYAQIYKYLFVLIVFLVALYFVISPVIPLYELIIGASELQLVLDRENSFKLLPPAYFFIFQLTRYFLLPTLAVFSYSQYALNKSSKNLLRFLMAFILCIFFASLALAKGPPLIVILFILIAHIYIRQIISLKQIIVFLLAFAIPAILAAFLSHTNDVFAIWQDLLFRRILSVTPKVTLSVFEAFPEYRDFLYGQGITVLDIVYFQTGFRLPKFTYQFMEYGNYASGWANSAFVGGAWAELGYFGIVLYSFIIGALIFIMQIYFRDQYRRVLDIPFYIFYLFIFAAMPIQSLTGTFFIAAGVFVIITSMTLRRMVITK